MQLDPAAPARLSSVARSSSASLANVTSTGARPPVVGRRVSERRPALAVEVVGPAGDAPPQADEVDAVGGEEVDLGAVR